MDGFMGTIMMCGFNFTPRSYGACNGALLQISENPALFSLLSDTYGGDGRTTMGLPNLGGRTPVNQDTV